MRDLLSLLPEEVDELMVQHGQPRYRADQLLTGLYRRAVVSLDDLKQLPAALLAQLREEGWGIAGAATLASVESEDKTTRKLLLAMDEATQVETVLMRYKREDTFARSSVCLSTQAGCAMGCRFCATGQMGFARNLTPGEIVGQVLQFVRLLRTAGEPPVTHVTFMGMGEPLANYPATLKALRLISHPRALGLAQRSVTVSTVGLVGRIDQLASEHLQVNLAISLHAPNDALRRQLIPTAAPSSIEALVAAGARYRATTGRRVTFQYALINGVNDAPAHAAELATVLRGSDAHVNLIPLNPTSGDFNRPDRRTVASFREILLAKGVNATVRSEKGLDIAAACGQLRASLPGLSSPVVRKSGDRLPLVQRP